jgi:hypothetical protein
MFRHVSKVRNVGVVVRENGAGERLNLGEPNGGPAEAVPRDGGRFDA